MKTILTSALALGALTLSASAQITTTGPFVGVAHEDFESHPSSSSNMCAPGGIFNNTGNICSPGGNGIWITGGWGYQCSLSAMGTRMLGAGPVGGNGVDITFNTPPRKFGGYFGMNHPGGPDITVSFYAGASLVSGPTVVLLPVNCTWNWLGWDFANTGVDKIHIVTNNNDTGYIHMDDLEVDYLTCVTQYNMGCYGSLGLVPVLDSPSCAVAGGSATIIVSNALGGANAIMLLGTQQGMASMGVGCFLNVTPLLPIQLNFPLNGSGPGNGGITIISGVPVSAQGVTVTLQVFVVDPGGLGGYSNTNGLQLDFQ